MIPSLFRLKAPTPIPAPAPPPEPEPEPLDEMGLRRPDFIDGPHVARIRLANGQEWAFPKPTLELRLDFGTGAGVFARRPLYGDGRTRCFGQGYLDFLESIDDAETAMDRLDRFARVAAYLLRQNYRLDDSHLTALLPFFIGEDDAKEESAAMWEAIKDLIGGIGPKIRPGGDESASSSPPG